MTQAAKREREGLAPSNGPKLNEQAKQFAAAARRALRTSNATRLLGFALESIDKGHVVLRLNAGTRHTQLHGVVHGGILAALADTAGAMAAYTMVPKGTAIATIEMKINYLEPVPAGRVRAEANRATRRPEFRGDRVRDSRSRGQTGGKGADHLRRGRWTLDGSVGPPMRMRLNGLHG